MIFIFFVIYDYTILLSDTTLYHGRRSMLSKTTVICHHLKEVFVPKKKSLFTFAHFVQFDWLFTILIAFIINFVKGSKEVSLVLDCRTVSCLFSKT